MISEFAQDLIDKLKAIPVLENRVGMAAGGGASDPSMATVPLPAAWVLFSGDQNESEIGNYGVNDFQFDFSVSLSLSYTNQLEVINSTLPTIEAIARGVSGKESTNSGSRWHYQGAQLVSVYSDRLVYELSFMVKGSYV